MKHELIELRTHLDKEVRRSAIHVLNQLFGYEFEETPKPKNRQLKSEGQIVIV